MLSSNLGIIFFNQDTSLFNNYKIALESYFKIKNFTEIKSINDLDGIDYIFIIDEHMTRSIWMGKEFIDYTNEKKIKVVVFNFEKIFNSKFKINIDFQKQLEKFENLHQFVSDVDDAEILGKKIITKQFLSKNTNIKSLCKTKKKDSILFLGKSKKRLLNFKTRNNEYEERDKILKEFRKKFSNFDVLKNRAYPYYKYLDKLASYKYILNPLGTGNFINIRFYEALELGSIPIQQVNEKMLSKYDELDFSLKFFKAKDFRIVKFEFRKFNYYLEDYFKDINLGNLIS